MIATFSHSGSCLILILNLVSFLAVQSNRHCRRNVLLKIGLDHWIGGLSRMVRLLLLFLWSFLIIRLLRTRLHSLVTVIFDSKYIRVLIRLSGNHGRQVRTRLQKQALGVRLVHFPRSHRRREVIVISLAIFNIRMLVVIFARHSNRRANGCSHVVIIISLIRGLRCVRNVVVWKTCGIVWSSQLESASISVTHPDLWIHWVPRVRYKTTTDPRVILMFVTLKHF